ncbi:NADP-dependent oxidoreductase [Lacisediminihabitans sp. G11-30]|uniref:NADP-dependent oxidoreductase n=2 Tax=Lacisediminihabitans changchengi TaxID=2787634 RepID=A0A934SPY3_9MICO|nr:NADP-dependent oxidoreductase [Lacisediminihabitans changchengi]MBK4349092.1 NADP-dependent oxidoreductase [Lacisediminihabitans changchengi]
MRAMVIAATGGPEVLTMAEVPKPKKVNAELLVKIVAAGINPIDAKTRAGGGVSAEIPSYPAILGRDFSGIVIESPFEACAIKPGDEIFGIIGVPRVAGTYAEYVAVPVMSVARKPPRLSHTEAAGVPLAALTAWGMVVDVAKAHEGQNILIHAGAGGVGHFAVQFAAYFGAHVIATGSQRNASWLRELGAAEVIDYTTTRFEEVLDHLDVVIDLVGNVHDDTGSRSLDVLRPGGLIINVPSGSWPTLLDDAEIAGVRATTYKVSDDGATLAVIARLLETGDVHVHVDEVFPLAEAAAAHQSLEGGHTRGKIVLTVSDLT